MSRTDVLRLFKKILEDKGYKYTQKELDVVLRGLDDLLGELGENLDVGDSVFVGAIKVSKIKVKPRKGKLMAELAPEGKELEWENPGKIRVKLSARESFIERHEKEDE